MLHWGCGNLASDALKILVRFSQRQDGRVSHSVMGDKMARFAIEILEETAMKCVCVCVQVIDVSSIKMVTFHSLIFPPN